MLLNEISQVLSFQTLENIENYVFLNMFNYEDTLSCQEFTSNSSYHQHYCYLLIIFGSKFPEMMNYNKRLETFLADDDQNNNNSDNNNNIAWGYQYPTANQLANLGFFRRKPYNRQHVVCFHCGLVLSDWSPEDIVNNEHLKFRPHCALVWLVSGIIMPDGKIIKERIEILRAKMPRRQQIEKKGNIMKKDKENDLNLTSIVIDSLAPLLLSNIQINDFVTLFMWLPFIVTWSQTTNRKTFPTETITFATAFKSGQELLGKMTFAFANELNVRFLRLFIEYLQNLKE